MKTASGVPYTIPAAHEITIRDLLRHTSGLTYQWNSDLGPMYKDANVASGLLPYDGTIGDSVKRLATVPLLFIWRALGVQPERWCSWAFDRSDFWDAARRILPDPYFRATRHERYFFFPPDNKVDPLATAYTYYSDKGLNRFPDTPITEDSFSYSADYPVRSPKKLFSGGAGLTSSVPDYARFCQLILNGGKLGNMRVLSPKSIELMTHDQLGKISPEQGFGLGFGVNGIKSPLEELGTPGQYGWGGFFYTEFSVDPKEDLIVIFMSQLHPAGDLQLNRQIHVLAYQAITN
jgi:CubicO group peptidase (beta-lactamase class C family)